MAISLAARASLNDDIRKGYADKLASLSLAELVKEFFTYLDYCEIKGMDDHEVHPITIGCGRVLMMEPLDMVLKSLRKKSNVE